MDLPPEYVLHLLPLMAICGISPPQAQNLPLSPKREEKVSGTASPRPAPILASIPYIDHDLGNAILKIIDQWRTLALWEPLASKEHQIPGVTLEGMFRVIPVDRSFRLPPQKARVSGDSGTARDQELHSPLSPLTPDSPLYPDGIMTTMWIRKHRDIIPSVFVSLYELKSEEKPHNISDEELARHLTELKKIYAERGVKLCAVLTGPWELESITSRLEYFRRNTTLDSKTSLFYLHSPPTENFLLEFFKTLRQSQYPFAIEHYRLRFNKTKRRRPRISPPIPNAPAPLDTKGWSVRTNFKLAAYSEYKQELDVAIKFYDLAYNELMDLFSSTAILPPRSRRWKEARVLADSISYKLCKLFLYLGDHSRVISTFNGHNKRMSTLCNGWGLGVETAEYWNWLSRKYQIFADLLDISETVIVGVNEIEEATKLVTGDAILNLDVILHHPGYYYLLAAECVRQQQCRTLERETSEDTKDNKNNAVELNALMYEKLSLSVEHFKKRNHRRTEAYVELMRCQSHYFSGKYDVAMELLQPVIRIYRAERWYRLLEEALLLALECAMQLEDDTKVLPLSLELLSNEFDSSNVLDHLKLPEVYSNLDFGQLPTIERDGKSEILVAAGSFTSFVVPFFTFQSNSAFAGSSTSFQLSLRSNARESTPAIVFSSARLSFNEQIPEIIVDHANIESRTIQKLGNTSQGNANLSLQPGEIKVLEFSCTPIAQAQIEALTLFLSLETSKHIFTIQFPFRELYLSADSLWYTENSNIPKVQRLGNPHQLIVHPKPPKVSLMTNLHGPAYIGEKLPIEIMLENGEDEAVMLEIQYQPHETEDAQEPELFAWHRNDGASQENILPLDEVLPGEQQKCILIFNAPLTPIECTLNLVIKYTLKSDRMTEIRKTLALDIPIIQPFHVNFDILPRLAPDGGMPDIFSEGDFLLHVSQAWLLSSSISKLGSEMLELLNICVSGGFENEEMSVHFHDGEGSSPSPNNPFILSAASHSVETALIITRREDADISLLNLHLIVSWRRQTSSKEYQWNSISIPIPELSFFSFTPRVLADITPHSQYSEYAQYLVTYTFENPTSLMANLDVHFEDSIECGFAGRNTYRICLLPFTSDELKIIVIPLKEEWALLPKVFVMHNEKKKYLEVLRTTDNLKLDGSDLMMRVPHAK